MADIAELTALIEPEVKALGFELVRIKLFGSGDEHTLQIMAENPVTKQLVIEDCAAISRRLSDVLDEADPIEEAYRLEVSSPGIDRPLTRLHDFMEWAGHEAKIATTETVAGRKSFRGTLKGVEGDDIQFKDNKAGEVLIPFAAVGEAKLVLTDALISATMPLSSEGADEFDTEE
ncbi:Ribosome maturation factor RimP [Sphingobium herbicidovorans NBRC 16415]|uniref:Ribosome maturation factor RimP n=1 Tax=Sphingobium herbicidovorans (strain ATCC 700291 / DSM 11019 / CCUG 56400 / KCTC 2939 / LMG 18315 / NBRC 16415 / MH) TaxID=1219045 RepID=A0A086PFA3_SPHHM|nr:ribosome maturation protein RimP [Sphingobium herbicidovorans]KFG92071.1 Ribosome maturation factor RimP [Sphingobium herbicidovorans NBRC 16415]